MRNVLYYTVGDGDVVMDGEKPRNCDKNLINLSVHQCARQLFWFGSAFKDIKNSFLDAWDNLWEPLRDFALAILIIVVILILMPILPWLIAFSQKRIAVKRCQKRGYPLKYKGQPEA